MTHTHDFKPHHVAVGRRQIVSWCTGCSRRRKQYATLCPDCNTGGYVERRDGCTRDCFNGYIVAAEKPVCCCQRPRNERCQACLDAHGMIHVCTWDRDEDIDHELRMATMPTPRTGKNSPETQALIDRIAFP